MKYSIIIKTFLVLILFTSRFLPQHLTVQRSNEEGISLSLEFKDPISRVEKNDENRRIKYLNYKSSAKPGYPILPSKTIFVAIPPKSKVSANVISQSVSKHKNSVPAINKEIMRETDSTINYRATEFKKDLLTSSRYPHKDLEVIDYTWIRNYYCAVIKINTHKFDWIKKEIIYKNKLEFSLKFSDVKEYSVNNEPPGRFDNLLSSIIINYNEASRYKSYPRYYDTENDEDWIDYNREYLKFGISKDGIYRIDYDDLVSYGVEPASINPKTIKIYREGNQEPVKVLGEDDESFDTNDYIEFWAQKNYSNGDYREIVDYGEDYINYMDRYTDTTIVWLTWGGTNGKRIVEDTTYKPELVDTLNSHITFHHMEEQKRLWYYDFVLPRLQLPFWQENKVFTWQTIGQSGTRNFSFNAEDIVTNSEVKSFARMISYASTITNNTHKIGTGLNSGEIQDTIVFDYRETVNLQSTFSSQDLVEGNNNFKLFGMQTEAQFNSALIDWVDIEYERYNRAIGDSLTITIPDNISEGEYQVKVSNITSNQDEIVIYKLRDSLKKIVNYKMLGTNAIVFTDTAKGGDRYFVTKEENVFNPEFQKKKQFVNLRSPQRAADYIILTNKILEESATNYKDYLDEQYGVRTELVFVEDIYDEFSYGELSAESIKKFVEYAFTNWQSPKPTYLLLIGDANYDYKDNWEPVPDERKKNLVPSYGKPVSDVWYVTLDDSQVNIPQMFVGRIPAENNEQVNFYLNKHQNYVNRGYDAWNKSYLFFSGGDPNKPSELEQIRNANENLFQELVKPRPVGGTGYHFYKTIDPSTNFGPFPSDTVEAAIDFGGLFISYLGHSGTQTWDNGITRVTDLKNDYGNRYPVITDFGCSTGKFAEPDVDAFGELFISGSENGEAIAYMGNASLGYLSTSLRFPELFYTELLSDSVNTIGEAHLNAKLKQFNQIGFGNVNRVFNYCNLLFGDPIISFSKPKKPNFSIYNNSLEILDENPTDQDDSIKVSLNIKNFGIAPTDSLEIIFQNEYNDSLIFNNELTILIPKFQKIIDESIPIYGLVGNHNLKVKLDESNIYDEIYEDDNEVSIQFNVTSTSLRNLGSDDYYSINKNNLRLLNPTSQFTENTEEIFVQISANPAFQNPTEITKSFDTVATEIELPDNLQYQRYFWRAKSNSAISEWTKKYSFNYLDSNFEWYIDSTFNPEDVSYKNTHYNDETNKWGLANKNNTLKITSAGSNEGKFASMEFNNQEMLPNTFFWGIATARIDTITLKPYEINYFVYPASESAPALIEYIEELPEGAVLAMAICDDGAQSVLGFSNNTEVRDAIKSLGSEYIDSVDYRESWCIIGKKGAPVGSVPESYSELFDGPAIVDTSKDVKRKNGSITFPIISNSSGWQRISLNDSIPSGSSIEVVPIGYKNTELVDTLSSLTFTSNETDTASLSYINAEEYPRIKLLVNLTANQAYESPTIHSIGIDYLTLPELAINYQVIDLETDSVYQGDEVSLNYSIFNVGEIAADSFSLITNLELTDGTVKGVLDTTISELGASKHEELSSKYVSNFDDGYGNMKFNIVVDPQDKVSEFYEDNNRFTVPFYVIEDTVTAVNSANVAVKFDGENVLPGEFVSANPEINVKLNYNWGFPYDDPDAVKIYLDDSQIEYEELQVNYDTVQKMNTYKVHPTLNEGAHKLEIKGENVKGNLDNQSGYSIEFTVSNKLDILNVYNYPNPFKKDTYFTFELTKVPQNMKITIFTIKGRKIKEITRSSAELKPDFNKIHWDGKDSDGNTIANGVYFYKVKIDNGEKSISRIKKLAVIK